MSATARAARAATAAALAVAAAACGGGSAADTEGVVRASWGDPQNPLEPANTNEVQGGKVLDMIFRGLKRYDPVTGRAENMLAESIETEDSQTFTVRIKDGWTFSNGEEVTADSFLDAWNYGALVDNKQVNSYFFQYVEGYEQVHPESGRPRAKKLSGLTRIDGRTFRVRLSQKFSGWPDTLGYPAFAPLPRAFFDDHDAWLARPVGNGPYRVESYERGSVMRLRPDPDYPGDDRAANDGVDLRVYTDNVSAYTDLQAGNLDVVDDVPASRLRNAESDLAGRYVDQPAGIIQTLVFPLYREEWNAEGAEKVRRGISRAIDRETITRQIFAGTRVPATDWTSPVLGRDGGHRPGLCGDACDYDPAAARKLVAAGGGIPGGRMTITTNTDTGSHRQWVDAVCHSINKALEKENACVTAPVGTFGDFRSRVVGNRMPGPFRAGWQMDYPLVQNFLQPLYYTGASSNNGGYSSRRFDTLVDRANAETDPAAAVGLFQEAERVLAEDMPAVPLWYQNGSAGWSERVSGVRLNPFSVPVFEQITVNGQS
ncbi:ABC transporter substrate-binding protein [Streptomyces sp. NPDC059506]|uniref:peptide ABC transporter substrate-binding protein n=1 Tax=unclassified Streptomyces TaxID=2593676 RepID=UPI0015FCFE7A|nr:MULTISPECIES: ABC transporter substrate-binding protein [unclassified Streptomyces]MCZ2528256.1 ABC transporter substrate-binding protein [Streptomyces sp. HB2AG]QMV21909.1 ABC transporter substrate-binding protein [Streptomyces sp. SCUT-3]